MKQTALLILAFAISLSSCHYIRGKRINGNGVSSSQERSLGDFHSIRAMGGMDVTVSQAPNSSLKIEADGNLLEYIETRNNGGTIEIFTREGFNLDPKFGIKVYASEMTADKKIFEIDFTEPVAIVMGSEDKGIYPALAKICDEAISIPMPGDFESLNVSVATGMILYEAVKQRM